MCDKVRNWIDEGWGCSGNIVMWNNLKNADNSKNILKKKKRMTLCKVYTSARGGVKPSE